MFGATGDLARRKLLPGLLHLFQAGLLPRRGGSSARRWRSTTGGVRRLHARGRPRVQSPAPRPRSSGTPSRPCCATCPAVAAPRRWRRPSRRPRRSWTVEVATAALPQRAAQGGAGGGAAARRGQAGRAVAGSSWRSRSAPTWRRRGRSTPRCTRSSTRSRSSGSTTSSARRRRRTSWRSGSRTACSSRSGTATTSTTCRSTCPRTLGLEHAAPRSTRPPAPTATWSSPTCSRCWPSWRWSRPPRWSHGPISEEKLKVFRSMKPIEPHNVVRGQYLGYREMDGVARGLRHRDLHRAQGARSTTGAGPACRSSCAPARSWPRARGSSRSRSRSRRARCSRRAPGVGAARARTT